MATCWPIRLQICRWILFSSLIPIPSFCKNSLCCAGNTYMFALKYASRGGNVLTVFSAGSATRSGVLSYAGRTPRRGRVQYLHQMGQRCEPRDGLDLERNFLSIECPHLSPPTWSLAHTPGVLPVQTATIIE